MVKTDVYARGTSLAATVAAEDLCVGDVVTILNETHEYPSFLWCSDSQMVPANEPVRIQWRSPDAGVPFKVKAVCLPFVLLRAPFGQHRTVDLRKCQLVRLSREYAKRAFKALRGDQPTRPTPMM
jgi:hypothetical protein